MVRAEFMTMATDSDKRPGDKPSSKRLGRMTVFRGLAGDQAIDATSAAIEQAAEDTDSDSGGPPSPTDSDVGARQARATDVDTAPARGTSDRAPGPASDSDKGAKS